MSSLVRKERNIVSIGEHEALLVQSSSSLRTLRTPRTPVVLAFVMRHLVIVRTPRT